MASPVGQTGLRHLLSQLSALATGRGGAGLLSALWLITAARILSPNDFGNLAILLAVGSMGGVLGDLGLQTALAHVTATGGLIDRRTLSTVIRRRLVMSTGAFLMIAALYGLASTDSSLLVPLVYAGSIYATAIYSTETAALTAVGRAQIDGSNEFLSRLAVLAAGWWWLHHGGGLLAAVAVYSIADVLSAVVITLIVRGQLTTNRTPVDLRQFRVRKTAKLAFALTAAVVYARVDTWLLGQLDGATLAGHYAAADKVLDAVLLVPAALGALSIAQISPLARADRWRRTAHLIGLAVAAAYTASKHGVLGLVRAAAAELAPKGVTVNAVCPAYVDTAMTDATVENIARLTGRSLEDSRRFIATRQPIRRLITPEEVAEAVLFCVRSPAVTGQGLNVDGGAVQS